VPKQRALLASLVAKRAQKIRAKTVMRWFRDDCELLHGHTVVAVYSKGLMIEFSCAQRELGLIVAEAANVICNRVRVKLFVHYPYCIFIIIMM
jgi:hypothetical protein